MIKKTLLVIAAAVLLCPLAAQADTVSYQPTPADLYDLDHYRHYEWGISDPLLSSGITVTGARLSFSRIRNWDNNPNDLYVHLLDTSPVGVTVGYDGQGGGDEFAGQGPLLVQYHNLPSYAQNLTHTFTAAQLASLNTFIADGNFGLGFDPDCHYYNCGATLTMDYVPEPATMSVLALGGLGLLRRRKK